MRKINPETIPFQISELAEKLNGDDNSQIKNNYRNRLEDIRDFIDYAIKQFDSKNGPKWK